MKVSHQSQRRGPEKCHIEFELRSDLSADAVKMSHALFGREADSMNAVSCVSDDRERATLPALDRLEDRIPFDAELGFELEICLRPLAHRGRDAISEQRL